MSDFKPGDFSKERKLSDEMELLGFSPDTHPLDFFDLSGCVESRDMEKHIDRYIWMAGWLIAAKLVKTRTKKNYMKFLSMEDLSGTFEVTLFPGAYQKFARMAQTNGPFRIHGKVENDHGALMLNVDRLELLQPKKDRSQSP